jgi:hypothetical protein
MLVMLLVVSGLVGCGSDNDEFTFNPNSLLVNQPFAGKLFLGATIGGAQITVEALDGSVLATSTTDATGNFLIRTLLPPDFRVIAKLSDGSALSREIRGFGSTQTFGSITVPSTLVSRLSQANPGESLETLEAQARQLLGMPQDANLNATSESVQSSFSHLAFFVRASQNGGLESYLNLIISSPGAAEVPYLLRRDVFNGSFNGLDIRLADVLGARLTDPILRRSTERLLSRGIPNPVIGPLGYRRSAQSGPITLVRAQEIAAADVLKFVGEAVGSSIIGQVTTTASATGYTWVAEQLGGHFGTTVELDAITQQLTDIQTTLDGIVTTLNDDKIASQVSDLSVFKDDIKNRQNDLVQAYDNAKNNDANYFNDQPGTSTLPADVVNVVNSLSQSATLDALTQDVEKLQEYLTGSTTPSSTGAIEYPPILVNVTNIGTDSAPNLLLELRDSILNKNGIVINSDTQQFGNFPVRSSVLLDQVLGPFEGYSQSQILGANLIGEAAHQSPTPGNDIPRAQAYADNVARSLQNTRAQFPDYPRSDNYFIDLQNGLMWYMVAQAPMPVTDAQAWAENFRGDEGSTPGWHLPSWDELKSLQIRGAWAASSGESFDFANTQTGLEKLGFNFDAVTTYDNTNSSFDGLAFLVTADWTYNNGLIGDNVWGFGEGLVFPLSTDNFKDRPEVVGLDDSRNNGAFLVCRTIGSAPCIDINPPLIAEGTNSGDWPDSFAGQPKESEETSVAVFSGFASVNVPAGVVEFVSEWTFNTGDQSFQVGTATTPATTGTTYVRSNTYQSGNSLPPVYFLTNDNAGSTFSSYPDDLGSVTNHANSQVVTTVTYGSLGLSSGVFPSVISGTFTFSTAGVTEVSLAQLQISPRNLTIDMESTDTAEQQFVAVGFYSDSTSKDLTNQVTWTVVDTNTNAATAGAAFANDVNGLLKLDKTMGLTVENLTVSASINDSGSNPSNVGDDTTAVRLLLD